MASNNDDLQKEVEARFKLIGEHAERLIVIAITNPEILTFKDISCAFEEAIDWLESTRPDRQNIEILH